MLKGDIEFRISEHHAQRHAGKSQPEPDAAGLFDDGLFERLRATRADLARSVGVPAYMIFGDRTLRELATRQPKSLDEMRAVHGVGAVKLRKYGEPFLEVIRGGAE